MSDSEQPEQQGGFSLGDLSAGEYDTSLSQPRPDAGPEEALELPRGALIAFRKSGGLRFRSRGLVVYRDGWVVPEDEAARPRRLSREALLRLARLILRARLGRRRPAGGQPPDGYAYELAARIGRRVRRAEAMTGAIPPEMAPLIRALERLGR